MYRFLNCINKCSGEQLIHLVCSHTNLELVKFRVANGANNDGKRPIDHTRDNGFQTLVEFLEVQT